MEVGMAKIYSGDTEKKTIYQKLGIRPWYTVSIE